MVWHEYLGCISVPFLKYGMYFWSPFFSWLMCKYAQSYSRKNNRYYGNEEPKRIYLDTKIDTKSKRHQKPNCLSDCSKWSSNPYIRITVIDGHKSSCTIELYIMWMTFEYLLKYSTISHQSIETMFHCLRHVSITHNTNNGRDKHK
jgi:hypothetical protein